MLFRLSVSVTILASCLSSPVMAGDNNEHELLQAIDNHEHFSKFAALVEKAALDERLSPGTSYTVFVPTNNAFENMPDGLYQSLLEEANLHQLVSLVDYHIVEEHIEPPEVDESELRKAALNGDELRITAGYGTMRVNNITFSETDLEIDNAVIYAIDSVLMPARDYAEN